MQKRQLGPFSVAEVGLGCMSLSHAYGTPPSPEDAAILLHKALDAGYDFLDTAALYGFGGNEELIGKTLAGRRDEFVLASKCGMDKNAEGKREINGRPEIIRQTCEDSLRRLNVEQIDLYYLHRWDKSIPVEESVGALGDLRHEGKIKTLGLSEVSAETLKKAHKEHAITAVQSEYSLWSRNPEIAVLDTCRELGVSFVAFSPIARAFLTDTPPHLDDLPSKDIRRNMPRFAPDNYAENLKLLPEFKHIAQQNECTMAQLALAWLLAKADHIIPIPGTTNSAHLMENAGASQVKLSNETCEQLDQLINQNTVTGDRYTQANQNEIDTEEFETA